MSTCQCTQSGLTAQAAGIYSIYTSAPLTLHSAIIPSQLGFPAGKCSFDYGQFSVGGNWFLEYKNTGNTIADAINAGYDNHIVNDYVATNFPDLFSIEGITTVQATSTHFFNGVNNPVVTVDTGNLIFPVNNAAQTCHCGGNTVLPFNGWVLSQRVYNPAVSQTGLFVITSVNAQNHPNVSGNHNFTVGSWDMIVKWLQDEEGMPTTITGYNNVRAWIENHTFTHSIPTNNPSAYTHHTGTSANPFIGQSDVVLYLSVTANYCSPPPSTTCSGTGYDNADGTAAYFCSGTTIANESAAGASDGEVTVSVYGGFSPYTYSWTNQNTGVVVGTTQTISGLPGTNGLGIPYEVEVTDSNGCTTNCTALVATIQPSVQPCKQADNSDALQVTCTVTPENFVGSADGSVTSVVTWAPITNVASVASLITFTYTWYDSAGTVVGTSTSSTPPTGLTVSGLSAGTYNFEVEVSFIYQEQTNRCIANCSVTIVTKSPPDPCITNPVTISITNSVAPTLTSTGSITTAPGGGTAPFSYQWTYPDGTTVNTQNITGLTLAGLYTIVITDDNGCTDSSSIIFPDLPVGRKVEPCCDETCVLSDSIKSILSDVKTCYGELACIYNDKLCLGQNTEGIFNDMMMMFALVDYIASHNYLDKNCDDSDLTSSERSCINRLKIQSCNCINKIKTKKI